MNDDTQNKRITSFFEFWPGWAMYLPVAVQWVVLSLRYQSVTLPFLANPKLHLSGMVGARKTDLMDQATGKAAAAILPYICHKVDGNSADAQAESCIAAAQEKGITLPFVCKPNIGCRGVGVKLIETKDELVNVIKTYPKGAELLCQKLASYESEAGIFYVKNPKTGEPEIPSMTFKILPRVTGDGKRTLGELIESDPRAGKLKFLYEQRHKDDWNRVPKKGESVRLVFSASHSKGAIFIDACDQVTPELTKAIHEIMSDIPDFYYGRLDVKFKDHESLKAGKNLQIVEINGASSESIHIWDKDTKFPEALRALLWQYRTLFHIGAHHRNQGQKPPRLKTFLDSWQTERNLTRHYPLTD